jgi:hypothetical protein
MTRLTIGAALIAAIFMLERLLDLVLQQETT